MIRVLKRWLIAAVTPTVFLALVGYFGWQATQGDRGLQAYAVRQSQLRAEQTELARVSAERDAWERRATGLKVQRLDRDTLDERARAMLNVADPADLVVPYPPGKKLF